MRLHFVSAPGGSAFMHELLSVVAHEVQALGLAATGVSEVTVSEGPYPATDPDDVFVVVPHEYFVVIGQDQLPTADQRARTIGFCVEHPGNDTFETTVRFASTLAACVDINDDSTSELARRGIAVERFVLGYSEQWDRWGGQETERKHDLIYLGTTDPRRSRLLTLDYEVLDDHEVLLAIPPHEPMIKPRPDFFMGEDKLRLLADSKVLLNLHRGESRALEWFRVLEAASNGCVVVSEHSPDYAPLIPGEHILFGSPRSLPFIARAILEDPERLAAIRSAAYSLLRTELTMSASALLLCEVAADVSAVRLRSRPQLESVPQSRPGRRPELAGLIIEPQAPQAPQPPKPPPPRAAAVADVAEPSLNGKERVPDARSDELKPERAPAAIDVVLLADAGARDVSASLDALLPQLAQFDVRIVICAPDPIQIPNDSRISVIPTAGNRIVSALANDAIFSSDAAFILLLDAVDIFNGTAVDRLMAALAGPTVDSAAAAYAMVVAADGQLVSALPFEPDRVKRLDYLAFPALWRREALVQVGGLSENSGVPASHSWDLWRRLANTDRTAILVPRILVRQTPRQRPVEPEPTQDALSERADTLQLLTVPATSA